MPSTSRPGPRTVLLAALLLGACGGRSGVMNPAGQDSGTSPGRDAGAAADQAGSDGSWAKRVGGAGLDEVRAVALDSANNIYITGAFSGVGRLDGKSFSSRGASDIFVARVSPQGKLAWVWTAGGPSEDSGRGVAVDSATGDVLVTGLFGTSGLFGSRKLQSSGKNDVFVVRLSPQGVMRWAQAMGGPQGESSAAVAATGDGGAVVAGTYSAAARFGALKLSSAGQEDIFVVRLDGLGQPLWVVGAGGKDADQAGAVARDSAGNVFICGSFSGRAQFGKRALQSRGGEDIFVARLSQMAFQWVTSAGGTQRDLAHALVADGAGGALVTGTFGGQASFGHVTLKSKGQGDAFLSRFNASGALIQSIAVGGKGQDEGRGLALDRKGKLAWTGSFQGAVQVQGGTALNSRAGSLDAYVAVLNPDWRVDMVAAGGGNREDLPRGVVLDSAGDLAVVGQFQRGATFSASTLTSSSPGDGFIWRIRR